MRILQRFLPVKVTKLYKLKWKLKYKCTNLRFCSRSLITDFINRFCKSVIADTNGKTMFCSIYFNSCKSDSDKCLQIHQLSVETWQTKNRTTNRVYLWYNGTNCKKKKKNCVNKKNLHFHTKMQCDKVKINRRKLKI